MSKTFNSAHAENSYQQLNIAEVDAGIRVSVDHNSHGVKGVIIAPSDAAALALAILEAAGVEPDREPLECQVSLGTIVADLQGTIQYAEDLASANREQAELEAEALELVNAWMDSCGAGKYPSWAHVETGRREQGLAVARKAREMRAEK